MLTGQEQEGHPVYAYPHPQNPQFNPHTGPAPYAHPMGNPMTRGQKIALGIVGGVTAVGATLAIILLPGKASAKDLPPPPVFSDPKPTSTKKPAGSPPPYGNACFPPNMGGGNAYDVAYWDAGGAVPARERIFAMFDALGYSTPTNRSTMNDPGPDAALGGNDDVPNPEVVRFQKHYNQASRAGLFPNMGGLWEDGLVGPCTLNGGKYVMDQLAANGLDGSAWQDLATGQRKL